MATSAKRTIPFSSNVERGEPHAADAKAVVIIRHAGVAGRARFEVRGLYRSPELAWYLEVRLSSMSGVDSAKANVTTGNLLVTFDPQKHSVEALRSAIADLVQQAVKRAAEAPKRERGQLDAATVRSLGERAAAMRGVSPSAVMPELIEPWHAMPTERVLQRLSTSPRGLSSKEVEVSRERFGANVLSETERKSRLAMLADQVKSTPMILLAGSAALSLATGGAADAAMIAGVIALNSIIGYTTESHAEAVIRSLGQAKAGFAFVLREGKRLEIRESELVVGDVLVVGTGHVPADARLIEARRLTVDESALTGESIPVGKTVEAMASEDVALADRKNMIYRGTVVTGGSGLGVVVATGPLTEIGKVQTLTGSASAPQTPMQRHLERLGNQTVFIASAVCGGVFVIGALRGYSLIEMLKSSISLAIAAVPEGLPTIGTTTLAFGVKRMEQQNVIVRRLHAVEALGAVEYFCMDKTGTITTNKMVARAVYAGEKHFYYKDGVFRAAGTEVVPRDFPAFQKLLIVATLSSESRFKPGSDELTGSATEAAIVQLAGEAGIDVRGIDEAYPRLKIRYRTEEHKFMFTLHRKPEGGYLIAAKGSPGEILKKCLWYIDDDYALKPMTDACREKFEQENQAMAEQALRVLAVGYREGDEPPSLDDGLVWAGLIGLKDPARKGIKELIASFHEAGIKTTMMTGDQAATALAIGKELGLNGESELSMADAKRLMNLSEKELAALSRNVQIFSRVSPSDKLKIVQVIQDRGKVVAMTGDGINDSPALKAADVGIAMGAGGTEVAREVADVVIADDNLQTMLEAIRQGRTIRANLRKSLHFLLATNLSEILIMFGAISAGAGQALTPMQLLWINLLTDIFPGLALALEPPEADIMSRPPVRSDEPIFTEDEMRHIAFESAMITAGSLAAFRSGVRRYGVGSPKASSMAFLSLTVGQMLHTRTARSMRHSIFSSEPLPPNPYIRQAVGAGLVAQALASWTPGVRGFLGNVLLTPTDSLVAVTGALVPFIINEANKAMGSTASSKIVRRGPAYRAPLGKINTHNRSVQSSA